MPTQSNLQLALEEQRSRHDKLCDDFNQLRARVLAFITGELALIAFLFATGTKVPSIVYGLVFFLFGVLCIVASFVILLFLLKAVLWTLPAHPDALKKSSAFKTKIAFLEYLCNAYAKANEANQNKNTKRVELFDKSLMLLITGVIILLVFKFGQGTILWQNLIQK